MVPISMYFCIWTWKKGLNRISLKHARKRQYFSDLNTVLILLMVSCEKGGTRLILEQLHTFFFKSTKASSSPWSHCCHLCEQPHWFQSNVLHKELIIWTMKWFKLLLWSGPSFVPFCEFWSEYVLALRNWFLWYMLRLSLGNISDRFCICCSVYFSLPQERYTCVCTGLPIIFISDKLCEKFI